MMNLDDVDESVKESIVSMANSIVFTIEEFINEGDDSVPSAEIKKLQRVSKKMKSFFSWYYVCSNNHQKQRLIYNTSGI